MPSPRKGETVSKFVARCVPILKREGKKTDQAVAICHSMFRQRKKKKKKVVNKRTFIANKRRMETFVTNIDARVLEKKTLKGREYYVAPVVLMTHGVHKGSRGPVYYPGRELDKWAHSWNHKPLTLNHPTKNGVNVSADDPEVMEEFDVGFLLNTEYRRNKQRAFAWIDIENAREKAPEFLAKVKKKELVEVSTGLLVDEVEKQGEYGGKKFRAIAKNHRPDHLAILMDEIGACSLEDGAGLFQLNSAGSETNDLEEDDMTKKELVDSLIANKATKWEEKDRKKLMRLDEDILVNMAPVNPGKSSNKTGLELDDDEEVQRATRRGAGLDDEDGEPIRNSKKKRKSVLEDEEDEEEIPVANKRKSLTSKEWMAAAPPEAIAMIRNMAKVTNKEKTRCIKAILNTEKGKARYDKERLEAMDIDDLQDIAAILTPDADDRESLAEFFGMGATVANRSSREDDEEEGDLDLPIYNFDQAVGGDEDNDEEEPPRKKQRA